MLDGLMTLELLGNPAKQGDHRRANIRCQLKTAVRCVAVTVPRGDLTVLIILFEMKGVEKHEPRFLFTCHIAFK